MDARLSTLYLSRKWSNITWFEMIRFFGIFLKISSEPRKIERCVFYFTESLTVIISDGCMIKLRGYEARAKELMPLVQFKHIQSVFHPEEGDTACNDKCRQLRFFIRIFNVMANRNLYLDLMQYLIRSIYYPVRQYNKDKPAKFRVDLFILADSKHYFIYHLHVYQGKNKANIDNDRQLYHLPTTQKGCGELYFKKRYCQ